jgi:hypothetical protein
MMLLTRSTETVDAVCSTGIVLPLRRTLGDVPGLQSRKYSPISDWGRASQNTSLRSEPKPPLAISISTRARYVRGSTSIPVTFPARTPATLTSPPSIMPNALSISTQ